ncbi:MAG: GNAT family N-acetyltransferase [bacterium]|nr:GNAT family N-acetyltransferase [bacterium]
MVSTIAINTPIRINVKIDPFSRPLIKILRLTMYKNLNSVNAPRPLPIGYDIEPWSVDRMREYGFVLKQAYSYTTDLVVYPELNSFEGSQSMVEEWTDLDGFLDSASFLVTKNNEPVAMILSTRTPASVFGQIFVVAVSPRYRRLGIGRHLVQRVLVRFQDIGLKHATLFLNSSNRRAFKFFYNVGFNVDGKAIYK